MSEVVNNYSFLLVSDKLMLAKHLKQARFTSSASRPLTTNKETIKKFKETRDTNQIYLVSLVFNVTWLMHIIEI